MPQRDVYVEFRVQGSLVKVSAIDSKTGTEVSIFGPRTTPRDALIRNAVAKLEYVLKRKEKGA